MRVDNKITLIIMFPAGRTHKYSIRRGIANGTLALLMLLVLISVWGMKSMLSIHDERATYDAENQTLRATIDRQFDEIQKLKSDLARADEKMAEAIEAAGVAIKNSRKSKGDFDHEINRNVVRVTNTAFRQISPGKLRLIMEMYNVDAGNTLEGRVIFSLRLATGQIFPLAHEEEKFKIIRFKKIAIPASLAVTSLDLVAADIVVEVIVRNTVVFRQFDPLMK